MTNDYWKERIKAEQEAKIERDASLGDEMKRLYDYHFAEIEKEIRAFGQRYADKNGLTLKDVKERVSEMDVRTFEEKAKRYVAEKDFSAKANSELSLYNLKMRMKRLELLQCQMDLEMVALADSEHKMTEKFLNQEYVKELELQAGLLGRSVLSDGAIKQMAQATLNTPFKGATWSSRIWERQDELRYIAAKMTEDLLLKGKNPTDLIPKLRKEFGVSANEARRLAVTEGARMATEAQKQAFDANGYTEYEFISEPKACDICKPLDGKIFKVKDMEPGKNASPMHPFCRCSTAAHYSLSDKEYERIIRESAESMGMEYRPPASMMRMDLQNLQTFAPRNDKKEILTKIANGEIDPDLFYERKREFDNLFKKGVKTPVGKVYNKTDAYYHIINRHGDDLYNDNGIKRIRTTLTNPKEIYRTSDSRGNVATSYFKPTGHNQKELMVVVRNGIITAYEAKPAYFKSQKQRGELIWSQE